MNKMMTKSRAVFLILGALLAGAIVGGGMLASADPSETGAQKRNPAAAYRELVDQAAKLPPISVRTNKAGQTFAAKYRPGTERPDFVGGRTDDGRPGYFRLDDWYPERDANGNLLKDTPVLPDANGDVVIPVYDFNGKVIGKATVATVTTESE